MLRRIEEFETLGIKVVDRVKQAISSKDELDVLWNEGKLRVSVNGKEVIELVNQGSILQDKVYIWLEGLLVTKLDYYGSLGEYPEHMVMNLLQIWELNRIRCNDMRQGGLK